MLALQNCPKVGKLRAVQATPKISGAQLRPQANTAPARVANLLLKGISWINSHRLYTTYMYLFTGFEITAQTVKQLEVAIDMHISMVQMRQYLNAGLAEGMDLRQVV